LTINTLNIIVVIIIIRRCSIPEQRAGQAGSRDECGASVWGEWR